MSELAQLTPVRATGRDHWCQATAYGRTELKPSETPLERASLDRLRRKAVGLSAHWGAKVSVLGTDRHVSVGRIPPLDRLDYLDHAERQWSRSAGDPRWRIFGITWAARPFANWATAQGASAAMLEPRDHKDLLPTRLYPGRFCSSWMTGFIGSNNDALAFDGNDVEDEQAMARFAVLQWQQAGQLHVDGCSYR